jgi:hypothetical protein
VGDLDVNTDHRVAIVGAGPHGLAMALHLLERDAGMVEDLAVFDPCGWLGTWHDQFARLEIDRLRSPGIPGCDPYDLGGWRGARGVEDGRPDGVPATRTFARRCARLLDDAGLAERVQLVGVQQLAAGPDRTILTLADGSTMSARHVVLAVNPARRRLPNWVFDAFPAPPDSIAHADDVDLRTLDLAGEAVVVVGGGPTAGHLALGAARRGAQVTLLSRRPLRQSTFDTDLGWLGPRQLDAYHRLRTPEERLRACLVARDGGSVPAWMMRRLRHLEADGSLELVAPGRVCGSRFRDGRIELVLGDESIRRAHRVWLATDTQPDVTAHRLTAQLLDDHPIPQVGGWPVLDDSLRWPGTGVHLLGRMAMLALGPAAGNLWGARIGAALVAEHVVGLDGGEAQSALGSSHPSVADTGTRNRLLSIEREEETTVQARE